MRGFSSYIYSTCVSGFNKVYPFLRGPHKGWNENVRFRIFANCLRNYAKITGGKLRKTARKLLWKWTKVDFYLSFPWKNASRVSTCEAKGLFLWKYFGDIIFSQILAKTFVFPKVFHENMCKTGANARCSLQKLTVFEKNWIIFASFRENTKNLVIFAKIFAAMFTKAKFFANFRIFFEMKVDIFVSILALNQRETKRGTGERPLLYFLNLGCWVVNTKENLLRELLELKGLWGMYYASHKSRGDLHPWKTTNPRSPLEGS